MAGDRRSVVVPGALGLEPALAGAFIGDGPCALMRGPVGNERGSCEAFTRRVWHTGAGSEGRGWSGKFFGRAVEAQAGTGERGRRAGRRLERVAVTPTDA